jgi:hypothetical protein
MIHQVSPSTYFIASPFRMYDRGASIQNNMVVFKLLSASSEHASSNPAAPCCLVLINLIEPSSQLFAEIRALEQTTQAKVSHLVYGSDWHHLFAQAWSLEFDLPVHFSGRRGVRLHANEPFAKRILDKERPRIDGVDLELIPWKGFHGPDIDTQPDELDRAEFAVFEPTSRTLYIFDSIVCLSPPKPRGGAEPDASPRYMLNEMGFRVVDWEQARASAAALLRTRPSTLLFSHGHFAQGAHVQGADECAKVLGTHLHKYLADPRL